MTLFNDGSFALHSIEQKGLSVLFELQKCQDSELINKIIVIYVNYLFERGASFLAFFFMKKFPVFSKYSTNLALDNAISIISKVQLKSLFLPKFFFSAKRKTEKL